MLCLFYSAGQDCAREGGLRVCINDGFIQTRRNVFSQIKPVDVVPTPVAVAAPVPECQMQVCVCRCEFVCAFIACVPKSARDVGVYSKE